MARCPEPGVTSQGESLVEAERNLKGAIELYIESFGLEDLPEVSGNHYWTTEEVEGKSHVPLQKVISEKTFKTAVPLA